MDAVQLPASFRPPSDADRGGNGRAAKIPVPEQLGLGLFPEPGAHLQCVPRGQAQEPAARRAAPRDLDDDAAERRQVELVAAEAPGYEHAVEAGLEELLVNALGVVGSLLGLRLLLDQDRPDRLGAREDLPRAEIRLRRSDLGRSDHRAGASICSKPERDGAEAKCRRPYAPAASSGWAVLCVISMVMSRAYRCMTAPVLSGLEPPVRTMSSTASAASFEHSCLRRASRCSSSGVNGTPSSTSRRDHSV